MLKVFWSAPLSAKLGVLVILAYVFVALFAPALAPYKETAIVGASYELWSDEYILGTDNIGRDIDRKSTRLNSSHVRTSRMPSSA